MRQRRHGWLIVGIGIWIGHTLIASPAQASLPSWHPELWQKPYVIQAKMPQPPLFRHALRVGLDILPSNAFFVGFMPNATYSLHLNDFWAWEVLHVGTMLNTPTSLSQQLLGYGVQPNAGGAVQNIQWMASSSIVIKPMLGNMAWMNHRSFNLHAQFGAGLALIGSSSGSVGVGLPLSLLIRLWINRNISLGTEFKEIPYVLQSAIGNIVLLGWLCSVSFGEMRTASAVAAHP